MSVSSQSSPLSRAIDELSDYAKDAYHDFTVWVARLDDTEKMFFAGTFILILFMLILVNAAKRPREPGNGRSFFGAVMLVIVFSFGVGWVLDSRLDLSNVL